MVRAFGPPRPPPQAPQLWAESCGLFWLCEPCPCSSKSRANPRVSPMSRSNRSAASIISATLKPTGAVGGTGARLGALDAQPGQRRGLDKPAERVADPRGQPREEDAGQKRKRRQHPEYAGSRPRPARSRGSLRESAATPFPTPGGSAPGGGASRRARSPLPRSPRFPGRITTGQRGVKWASAAPL